MKLEFSNTTKKYHLENCRSILSSLGVNVNFRDLCSDSRIQGLVFERALCVMILRNNGLSFMEVGAALNRDHSWAVYMHYTYWGGKVRKCKWRMDLKRELETMFIQKDINSKKRFIESKIKQLSNQLAQLNITV